MRWLSAFLSALIVGALSLFYFWHYVGQMRYLKERDQRLVGAAARALSQSLQADRPETRITRDGARITVYRAAEDIGKISDDYSIDLVRVLAQVPRPDCFTALLVADSEGQVLAQHPRAMMDGLRDLRPLDSKSTLELDRQPRLDTLKIGGSSILSFCHPVQLPHRVPGSGGATNDHDNALVFCGLVPEDRLTREAAAVSPLAVGLLLAVFIVTLLIPPFLKVRLLARSERLGFADAYALAICMFLGLMISATAILGAAVYVALAAVADSELHAVAAQVKKHLADELVAMQQQLSRLDACLRSEIQEARRAKRPFQPLKLGLAKMAACQSSEPPSDPSTGLALLEYPYFDDVAWISGDGMQRVKWYTATPERTTFFSLSSRAYFRDVRDGHTWSASHGDGWPDAFVLDSVRALSSGEVRAVFARASSASLPGAAPPIVQALTARVVSLTDPVLPVGAGFAVVDSGGNVLFHSDAVQSHTHNFLNETDGDRRLRAVILAGGEATLTLNYWGKPFRMHVEPLGPLPWSLVVFQDRDLLRAISVEAIGEAVVLSALFALALFFVPTFLFLVFAGRRTPFPWPEASLTQAYLHLTGTFLLIGTLYVVGLANCRAEDCWALAIAVPIGAVTASIIILAGRTLFQRYCPDEPPLHLYWSIQFMTVLLFIAIATLGARSLTRSPLGLLAGSLAGALFSLCLIEGTSGLRRARWFRIPHRLASTGFWLLLAVLPALGFLKGATERSLEVGAGYTQQRYLQSVEQRARLACATVAEPSLCSSRLRRQWDIEDGTLFEVMLRERPRDPGNPIAPGALPASAGGNTGFWRRPLAQLVMALKPILAEHAMALRYSHGVPRSPDGLGLDRWARVVPGQPDMWVSVAQPSFWQLLGHSSSAIVLLVCACLALVAVIWSIVVWSERFLFATEVLLPTTLGISDIKHGKIGASTVLVLASGFESREVLDGDWFDSLETAAPATAGAPGEFKPVLLTEPPFEVSDQARRRERLERLEALIFREKRKVFILASRDPIQGLLDQSALEPGEVVRWRALLEAFQVAFARSSRPATQSVTASVRSWLRPPDGSKNRTVGGASTSRLPSWLRVTTGAESSAVNRLVREILAAPHLYGLLATRLAEGSLARLTHGEQVRRIEEVVSTYYRSLWERCGPEERLTLVQVADEGFLNPGRLDVLRILIGKGLVEHRPMLQPMNESFRLFLARADNRTEAKQAEKAEIRTAGSGWANLRGPLVALGVAAGSLLFLTERALFESASVLSTAIVTAVIPLLGQASRAVQSLRSAQGPSTPPAAG